jgi:hypothetical protein
VISTVVTTRSRHTCLGWRLPFADGSRWLSGQRTGKAEVTKGKSQADRHTGSVTEDLIGVVG